MAKRLRFFSGLLSNNNHLWTTFRPPRHLGLSSSVRDYHLKPATEHKDCKIGTFQDSFAKVIKCDCEGVLKKASTGSSTPRTMWKHLKLLYSWRCRPIFCAVIDRKCVTDTPVMQGLLNSENFLTARQWKHKQIKMFCVQSAINNSGKLSETSEARIPDHISRNAYHSLCSGYNVKTGHHSECDSGGRERWYGTSSDSEAGDPLSPSSVQFKYYMDHLRNEHQLLSEKLQGGETLTDSQQRKMRAKLFELSPIIDKWEELNATEQELRELDQMIEGSPANSQDREMQELALSEKAELCSRFEVLKEELIELLMPSEDTDDNDILMEFSAGVGGQEAMLFASDMFEMYQRYANFQGWTFNVLEYFTTDIGGLRHASVSVSGEGAYRLMRHEGGVHRVQRVPKTERQGRVHTSTMTIAVLPQPKEIDLKLDPKDLKIETKKASGAGGQHVNTTDSAVRITHIPTGITAESQQERSQHKNKSIAMTMLQTRIYNIILAKQESSERTLRHSQVGSSGRSEKIRTYNFQQDRITDHRIGRSVHDVQEYLSGSELLDDMIQSVVEEDALMELKRTILDVFDTR